MPTVPTVFSKNGELNFTLSILSPLPSSAPDVDAIFSDPTFTLCNFQTDNVTFYIGNDGSIISPQNCPPVGEPELIITNSTAGSLIGNTISSILGDFAVRGFFFNEAIPLFAYEYEIIFDDPIIQAGTYNIAGYNAGQVSPFNLEGLDGNGDFAFISIWPSAAEYTVLRMIGYDETNLSSLYGNYTALFTVYFDGVDYFTAQFVDYVPPENLVVRSNVMMVKDAISLPCYNPCLHYAIKEEF